MQVIYDGQKILSETCLKRCTSRAPSPRHVTKEETQVKWYWSAKSVGGTEAEKSSQRFDFNNAFGRGYGKNFGGVFFDVVEN